MTSKIKTVIIFLALSVSFSCTQKSSQNAQDVPEQDLLGYDYRLFKTTPLWELAQAVEKQDTTEIARILKITNPDVNLQDAKYGNTLLMLTVMNLHYNSAMTLLSFNANPNINATYDGATALILASEIADNNEYDTAFIKLLLKHRADPNLQATGFLGVGNSLRRTPLLAACRDLSGDLLTRAKVEILVEAGANINYEDEFGNFPLKSALINRHYDVVLYLLDHGADYKKVLIDRSEDKNGEKLYIANVLREHLFPLGSPQHQRKMKVVAFLKKKGIDYNETPIPDFIQKKAKEDYPDSWKEYLQKY